MELAVLKKKLASYRSKEGKLKKVPGELLIAVLRSWEGYTRPMSEFSKEVGLRLSQLGPLIHRARLYSKNTLQDAEDFAEIKVESPPLQIQNEAPIELNWDNGKVIRFKRADELVDFLKKVA